MSISFHCSCGERLEVDDEFAGKQARCPYCEAVVSVPAAGPPPATKRAKLAPPAETDDDHGAYAGSLNPLDRGNRPSSRRREADGDRPSRRRGDEDEEDDRRPRRASAYDDEDDDRPRRRRRFEPPPYKLFNNQTIGGAIAVAISLTVFVGALFLDMFWWGMLIIAVLGVISIIRGLISGRDG